METTINLYQKLWATSDDLRSQMDANEYKNNFLVIIFNLLNLEIIEKINDDFIIFWIIEKIFKKVSY